MILPMSGTAKNGECRSLVVIEINETLQQPSRSSPVLDEAAVTLASALTQFHHDHGLQQLHPQSEPAEVSDRKKKSKIVYTFCGHAGAVVPWEGKASVSPVHCEGSLRVGNLGKPHMIFVGIWQQPYRDTTSRQV